MGKKDLPVVSAEEEMYLNEPYGGLFGDTVLARMVEELIADPVQDFRPKYLENVTGKSESSIKTALRKLSALGLVEKKGDDKHPVYRVIVESKKFAALSFLAYAMLDDRDGSDCMNTAVYDYYNKVLREEHEPEAIANSDNKTINVGIVTTGIDEFKTISGAA
jgi:DNA-binding transcriptional ArsR family regulator